MDVQTRASLSRSYFWSEGYLESHLVGEVADDPFGKHQLVGCLLCPYWQKFYLILLIHLAVEDEVAHL